MTVLSAPSRRVSPGLERRLRELGAVNVHAGPVMNGRRGRPRASGATPRNTDELAEWLAGPGLKLMQSGTREGAEQVATTIGTYVRNAQSDGSIQAQVAEQVQAGLAEFARDQGVDGRLPLGQGVTPQSARSVRSALNHPAAVGAAADGLFADLPAYLRAISPGNQNAPHEKLRQLQNVGSTIPSEGGFLIPEQLRSQLLHVSLETSIVRPRATVIPVSTLRTPVPTIDSTSNVSSVFGGVVGHWAEEGAQLVPSEPSFARVTLEAKKLAIYADVPNELWSDSVVSLPASNCSGGGWCGG